MPNKTGEKLYKDTHDMVHLKKKRNFTMSRLKKDAIVFQKKDT